MKIINPEISNIFAGIVYWIGWLFLHIEVLIGDRRKQKPKYSLSLSREN
jgi:hypothetical protein